MGYRLFKWVIGCVCCLTWKQIHRQINSIGGGLKLVCGLRSSINKMEIDFIRETRAWVWRYSLWIWWCHSYCPYFFWTVPHLFFI